MKKWVLLSCLVSVQSWASSISTYRIYLDGDNRQQKFIVKNSNAVPEKCDLSFGYMAYKENGEIKPLSKDEQTLLSTPALQRFRYSPQEFTIAPKSFQYIAFTFRRQINDVPAEYRTYANIKCLLIENEVKTGVNLKPTIMHSVPLIVRSGRASELSANLTFSQISHQENEITFRLDHQGNRSVFGDINLVNAKGEKLKLLQRNVVLYPEMKYKDFAFSLGGFTGDNLQIEFEETGNFNNKQKFSLAVEGED